MALYKLLALGILILNIHGRDAVQICLGNNNANINQNSPILIDQRQQQILNNNNKQCSPMTNINNKVIEVKRQQRNNGNIANVPMKLKQMNLQPLTTSMSKVSAAPVTVGQVKQTSPSQTASLGLSTPAASPITSLLSKSCGCNKSKQTSLYVCSQQQNRNVPSTLVSNNHCQCQLSTPITLTFSNIQTENPSIQLKPAVSCVQAQSNSGPLQLTVDTTQNPTHTSSGKNSPSTVQNQPSLANQLALPVTNEAAIATIQETPVIEYNSPVKTQFVTAPEPRNEVQSIYTSQPYPSQPQCTSQSYIPSGAAYPASVMFPPMPPPSQKTSNLKLLLPLLFNLLKENNMNCGCQSHCNCNKYCNRNFHDYDYEPQVFSGYSNSASFGQNSSSQFGPLSAILGSDEYDILAYPGPFRERKINGNNKNSGETESQENDISEESKTEMNEIDDGYRRK